jgi:O-antigen ligase
MPASMALGLDRAPEMRGRGWLPFAAIAATVLGFSCMTVTVTGAIAAADAGSSLKLYHCIFALVLLGLAFRGRLRRVRAEMLAYFAVTLTCSFLAMFAFGVVTRPLINAVFLIGAAVSGTTLGAMIDEARAMRALRVASAIFIFAVVAKAVVNVQAFIRFFANPWGHPILPTFSVGGANLEATWVSLAAIFFIGSAWFLPYCALALAISLLYASRVGVIIVVLALVMAAARAFARRAPGAPRRVNAVRVLAVVGVLAVLSSIAIAQYGDGLSYVAKRFQSIGDDPGSLGRFTLWNGGAKVFVHYPLGVGQGNAVPALEHEIGADVPENNLHNLYLQHLVETGLPGLIVYLLFGVVTWRRYRLGGYQDVLLAYVLCYLAISSIQFSGGDPLLWFVWGIQSGLESPSTDGAPA